MPIIFLIVGLIAILGGRFLISNDVGQFGVPIFLTGLIFCAVGIITFYLVMFS